MTQEIIFDVLPPSANASHRIVRGMLILSKECREFRHYVAQMAIVNKLKKHQGIVEIEIMASYGKFKNGNQRTGDITNLIKQMQDALNKIAWEDDSQIHKCTITKMIEDKRFLHLKIIDGLISKSGC